MELLIEKYSWVAGIYLVLAIVVGALLRNLESAVVLPCFIIYGAYQLKRNLENNEAALWNQRVQNSHDDVCERIYKHACGQVYGKDIAIPQKVEDISLGWKSKTKNTKYSMRIRLTTSNRACLSQETCDLKKTIIQSELDWEVMQGNLQGSITVTDAIYSKHALLITIEVIP